MKILALLLAISLMVGCNPKSRITPCPEVMRIDTVEVPVPSTAADLSTMDLKNYTDSITRVIDTLRTNLFISNYKVEKVKYYLAIVLRNPSQEKFFKGWIRRAVE